MKNISYILDKSFHENKSVKRYLEEKLPLSRHIRAILLLEEGDLFQKKDKLLEYQNMLPENHPCFLKDFLTCVTLSSEAIVNSILTIAKDEILAPFITKEPKILGYHVSINIEDKTIENESIKKIHKAYMQALRSGYAATEQGIREGTLPTPIGEERKRVMHVLNLGKKSKNGVHPSIIANELKKIQNKMDREKFKKHHEDNIHIIDHYKDIKETLMEKLYYATNLADEKIIKKKEMVLDIKFREVEEEYLAEDAGQIRARDEVLNYEPTPVFGIGYYIKKRIIEEATGESCKVFMCSVKDYFTRKKYEEDIQLHKKYYNEEHRFIMQNKAKQDLFSSVHSLTEALQSARSIIIRIKYSKEECRYPYVQWEEALKETRILFGYKNTKSGECDDKEMMRACKKNAKRLLSVIYQREVEKNGETILSVLSEEIFIRKKLEAILDFSIKSFPLPQNKEVIHVEKLHNRATFHTEMIDSIVVDLRGDEMKLNDLAETLLEKHPAFPALLRSMEKHPYHNYYEIDRIVLVEDGWFTLSAVKAFLDNSMFFSPLTQHSCSLKFRKLENYQASGVYFSHNCTMGIDFRNGRESYIHELAHHIDLNGYHPDRNKIIVPLVGYFHARISRKREYFMRKEELIARAAEIALLLRMSTFVELHKKGARGKSLVDEMKRKFKMSSRNMYMKRWEVYASSAEYICVPQLVEQENFDLLWIIYDYFQHFWGVSAGQNKKLKDMKVSYTSKSLYPQTHKSYNYYMCEIAKIKHPQANIQDFLEEIGEEILGLKGSGSR